MPHRYENATALRAGLARPFEFRTVVREVNASAGGEVDANDLGRHKRTMRGRFVYWMTTPGVARGQAA